MITGFKPIFIFDGCQKTLLMQDRIIPGIHCKVSRSFGNPAL